MGTFTPLLSCFGIYPVIVFFGCQFLVKLFSLNRRFKIKAPDLAIPFLWGGTCVVLQHSDNFYPAVFLYFCFTNGHLYCGFSSILL